MISTTALRTYSLFSIGFLYSLYWLPPTAPSPMPRSYEDQLECNAALIPPLVTQPPADHYEYCHHTVLVEADTITGTPIITGAPMVNPFEAMYDRPRLPIHSDFTITSDD
jgi:hypothetical protein